MSTTNELSLVLSVVLKRVRLPVIRAYSRPVADFNSWSEVTNGQPKRYVRSMSDEEEKMSLKIWCDFLEGELKRALEDLSVIRGLDKTLVKSKSHMLRAALNNAQDYLREIQDSLR
jgi:hypothetical protein